MKKTTVSFLLLSLTLLLTAAPSAEADPAGLQPPPQRSGARNRNRPGLPPPGMGRHPLLIALESDDFTPEERTRLKKLAQENPRLFNQEMRRHFQENRKRSAQELLRLREACRNAKTPEERAEVLKQIRARLNADIDRRFRMEKRLLEETEKSIRSMEERLNQMKKRYEEHLRGKDRFLEAQERELTGENPPERLLMEAAGKRPPRRK